MMKKILLVLTVLFTIWSSQTLKAQLKDEVGHTVTAWSTWSTTNCHKGIAWRVRQNFYSGNNNGFTWEYEVKNTYGRQVAFSYEFSESDVSTGGNRMRKTLGPNGVYRNTALPNAARINYFVFSVCFSSDGKCKDECYSPCDNGTPNIPDCALSTSSAANNRAPVYSANNQSIPASAPVSTQPSKQLQQAAALTTLSNSILDLAASMKQQKINKAAEREKEAYDKINTTTNPKMFEGFTDFIVSAMASENFKLLSVKDYYRSENYKKVNLHFDGCTVELMNIYSTSGMFYSMSFRAYNNGIKNNLDNSALLGFLKNYDRYEGIKSIDGRWDGNTFKISTFKLETSDPFLQVYENGYTNEHYSGAKAEIDQLIQLANDEKTNRVNKLIADFEKYNYWNSSRSFVFGIAKEIGEAYEDEKILNDKDKAVLYYKKAATIPLDSLSVYWAGKKDYKRMREYEEKELAKIFFKIGFLTDETNGKDAIEWYNKSAVVFKTNPYRNIARIYRNGLGGIEKDWNLAKDYYEKAAHEDDAEAMNILGKLYATGGFNLEKDESKSKKWFKKACKEDKKYCN